MRWVCVALKDFVTHTWVVTHLFTVEQFERNLPGARLMHTTGFPVCPHVSKPRIVLNWCEMFVGWLQRGFFFPTPWHIVSVFHSSQVFSKPSRCCLLGGSHMPHAECFFMSCFWTENTWTQRLWIPHCLTEQRVQLKQSVHVHLLSVEGWGYILLIYAQWLHLHNVHFVLLLGQKNIEPDILTLSVGKVCYSLLLPNVTKYRALFLKMQHNMY